MLPEELEIKDDKGKLIAIIDLWGDVHKTSESIIKLYTNNGNS